MIPVKTDDTDDTSDDHSHTQTKTKGLNEPRVAKGGHRLAFR